jgi:hypothetical protein
MKFIVPIRQLRAAMVCVAKNDVRYYLNGIHFKSNRIESTNGHVAYMSASKEKNPDWFDGEINPSELIVNIDGKVPASTRQKNIQWAVFEITEDEALIRYMDICGVQVAVGMGEVVVGRYPNTPKLLSTTRKSGKTNDPIGVNTEYLAMLNLMMKGELYPLVKMESFDDKSAMIFTLRRVCSPDIKELMLIMPARL